MINGCSCASLGISCRHHTPPPNPAPLRVVRLDGATLAGGPPASYRAGHSNASVVRHGDRLLLIYRHKSKDAALWLTGLDPDTYQPHGPGRKLALDHFHAKMGQEDPIAFHFRGRVCFTFAGVEGRDGPTSQLLAVLNADATDVDRVVYLDLPGREKWEKSWSGFEHDGSLYVVYGIHPQHVILKVDPESGRCERAHSTPTPLAWSGGCYRGGAAPVRDGDSFLTWFHGRVDTGFDKPTYTAGVYAFEAKPPFRVTRMTPTPILWGDSRTCPPHFPWHNVVFPRGAILEGGTWIVSAGVHDQFVDVFEFDATDVCKRLLTAAGVKAARGCK